MEQTGPASHLDDRASDAHALSVVLTARAERLVRAGRLEEGLAAYERLLELLDGAEDLGLRVRRVAALVNSVEALSALDRLDEALDVHERLVAEVADDGAEIFGAMAAGLGDRDDPEARVDRAAMAFKHAAVERSRGREDEAGRVLAALVERHAEDDLPGVRRIVGMARALIEDDDVL